MQDMARMAWRIRKRVWPKIWNILPKPTPRMRPEKRAARKQPVPVAVSQLKSNLAFSAVGLTTTGAERKTALWRYGTSQPPVLKEGVVALPIAVFTVGRPQRRTKMERRAQGSQALAICPPVYFWPVPPDWRTTQRSSMVSLTTAVGGSPEADSTRASRSSGKRQIFLGFQTRR